MKGNDITPERTEGYISTFTITNCRKVAEDVEANNQSTTTCLLKIYELEMLEEMGLLGETEIPVSGLERQKIVVLL